MILAGDIGGTNTRLAVFDHALRLVAGPAVVPTTDEASFDAGARALLAGLPSRPTLGCFAVAGPVLNGRAKMTNVDRTFDEASLEKSFGIAAVTLINDLVANVSGIEALEPGKLVTLLPGNDTFGNRAILSPGTGLGEAGAVVDSRRHRPVPSEGGHCHFAPTTERDGNLCRFLAGRFETVTWERVLSGPGIVNLFDFCRSEGTEAAAGLAQEVAAAGVKKGAVLISEAAAAGRCPASVATLQLFARLLGLEAANLALKFLATGGVYLGGGIPPKNLPFLQSADFRDAFLRHQTMGPLLAKIPVRVILDDHAALEGAALYGMRFGRR